MRILVYGAGVLGSVYAARLWEGGHEVKVLARGQRLADIRRHGIVLEEAASGRRTVARLVAVEELAPEEAFDLVLVVVRKNQLSSVLPALAANTATPNVLFLMNNPAGPEEIVQALGRERVLLGFPGAGGVREGHIIRYTGISGGRPSVTMGELDGGTSERLETIGGAFRRAGIRVKVVDDMDAWLKTHVALVSPIANAIYAAGGDNYRLARTRDGLVLMVRAVREGVAVLEDLGVPITPPSLKALARLPESLLVAALPYVFNQKMAELGMAGHANAARDEMKELADEFRALARRTTVPTPASDQLYSFVDPATPPLPEGSTEIPVSYRGLWLGLGAAAAALLLVALARRAGGGGRCYT